jgi:hypothetical protein
MAGRKVVDASDAQFCLAEAAAGGLTGRVWARQNGVDAGSLHAWRMTLGRNRGVVGAVESGKSGGFRPESLACGRACPANFVTQLQTPHPRQNR